MKNWAGNQTYHAARLLSPRSVTGAARDRPSVATGSGRSGRGTPSTRWPTRPATTSRSPGCRGPSASIRRGGPSRWPRACATGTSPVVSSAPGSPSRTWRHSLTSRSPGPSRPGPTDRAARSAAWRRRCRGWKSSARTASSRRRRRDRRRCARGERRLARAARGRATLTLEIEPTFRVRQQVFDDVPFDAVVTDLDEVAGAAYSVSLLTDWRTRTFQVWLKHRGRARRSAAAAVAARGPGRLGSIGTRSPASTPPPARSSAASPVRGTSGSPISGWASRRARARSSRASTSSDAPMGRRRSGRWSRSARGSRRTCRSSEVRFVAADRLWLSPAYGRRVRDDPLHLEAGLAGRPRRAPRDRGGPGPVRTATALGQALHDGPGRRPLALRADGRLRRPGPHPRPDRQVP